MKLIANGALAVARSQIGVKEIGFSNTGNRVQQYQAATTLGGTGWSWCAAFIAWCIAEACRKAGIDNPWLNSASCDFILYWARDEAKILKSTPEPGDVGLCMKSKNDATHIFFVEKVNGKRMTTIEGNTNNNGSSNGDGVYRLNYREADDKRKDGGPRYVFVRWSDLVLEVLKAVFVTRYKLQIGPNTMVRRGSTQPLKMPLLGGTSYAPVEQFGAMLGLKTEWDEKTQTPIFVQGNKRRAVNAPVTKFDLYDDGTMIECAPIRKLVDGVGLKLALDDKTQTVKVYR